jgi:VWFA-related protein
MQKSGQIVYGLSADDFIVEDNGVEQRARLDESPEAEPVSLVVAVQVGRSAALHFTGRDDSPLPGTEGEDCRLKPNACPVTMAGLGAMLESFIGGSGGEVAVVTFDSQVKLFQNFTADLDGLSKRLKTLEPGDGGAAILDSVRYSLDLLEKRPRNQRRILLLISEERDHGSRKVKLDELAQHVGASSAVVYSVTFSPLRSEFVRDVKGENPNPGSINILNPIMRLSLDAMKKNVAKAIAEMTGGESRAFKNRRTFDDSLATAASHSCNRYQLSFQPKEPKFGPHVLTVRLRNPQRSVRVIARNAYWAEGQQ